MIGFDLKQQLYIIVLHLDGRYNYLSMRLCKVIDSDPDMLLIDKDWRQCL